MRYADTPTVAVEADVAAPIERVWAAVTDVCLPARFSSEFQGARWANGHGPALGAAFIGLNHHPAIGEWETTSYVVELDPPTRFGWAVTDTAHPAATWRFVLTPTEATTSIRFEVQIGPGRSGLSAAIEARPHKEEAIVAARLAEHRTNMTATLEGLKAHLERPSSSNESLYPRPT